MSSSPGHVSCAHCGAEHPEEALFCPACGRARRSAAGEDDPLLGTVVGERYVLHEQIGQGGSGTIYRGEHVTLRRKVAVKVLHEALSQDDLAIERFRREATTVSEIDNDHIVEIYDFGRAPDGRLYLAMELLSGEPLADVLAREGQLSVARAVDVLVQLGEALMEAHAMGYVHRDLRPSNVYLTLRRGRSDFVKLLDFGLAKLVEREGEAASTSLGMTFGDPRYMSPEQARGDPVDRRADIYSMGCIAYEMLTGAPPFTGGRVFDILTSHVEEQPAPLRERREDAPSWLETAVARMLAKAAGDRFITVYRLGEALKSGRARGEVMTDEIARRPETEPPPSVSRAMAKLAARDAGDEPPAPAGDGKRAPEDSAPGEGASGISGAWFADGEGDRAGEAVDAGEEGGRASISPGETGIVPDYADRSRRMLWIAGAAVVAAVGLVAAALSWPSGGGAAEPSVAADAGLSARAGALAADAAGAPAADAAVAEGDGEEERGRPAGGDPEPSRPGRESPAEADEGRADARRPGGSDRPEPGGGGSEPVPEPEPEADAGTGRGFAGVGRREVDAAPSEPESGGDQGGEKVTAADLVREGRRALGEGDILRAAASFNRARSLSPENADAISGLGEIALAQGYDEDAVAHLERAVELRPGSGRFQTLLGEAYLGAGKTQRAAERFERALQLNPDNERAAAGYREATGREF